MPEPTTVSIPPVFCLSDVTPGIIEDFEDASQVYWSYSYTSAFDELLLVEDRRSLIDAALRNDVSGGELADGLKRWLLGRWSSARSLSEVNMKSLGIALSEILPHVALLPAELTLESVERRHISQMIHIFDRLVSCRGVGTTIASKVLAPLRPALFAMWDNPIADAYGFAQNGSGYHQYLTLMREIARLARSFWSGKSQLEEYLKPTARIWTPPLAKTLDEWNWVRITKRHRADSRTIPQV